MDPRTARLLAFGDFELEVRAGELRKHGLRIRLQDQSFQILLMLLDRPGEVVLREEIRQKLWPNNTIVEFDHSINAAIKRLRNALGESAEEPRYIETLAKRGYRFAGEVENVTSPSPDPPPVAHATTAPNLPEGDLSGRMLAHYRILDKLGEGGMGVVYRAEDTRLGRLVALKLLPSPASEIPATILHRFEREARAASALNHPYICTIYGLENCDGQPVIVMELVEGEILSARLSKGRIPLNEALRAASQIAAAMAEAHRKGVVHRDLKPANVVLTKSGVKILDFGLAKMEHALDATAKKGGTIAGAVLGTPHYMSPEQAQGKEADARSDIFSFGVIVYEMLAAKKPFEGQSAATIMAAIMERDPPALGGAAPASLDRAVCRCLAKNPDERWQSARDLQAELEWIAASSSTDPPASQTDLRQTRRIDPRWIAVGALATLFIAMAAVFFRPKPLSAPVVRFTVSPPEGKAFGGLPSPSVSPDGRRIIFETTSKEGYQYWIRTLDSPNLVPVPGADGGSLAFWSPDSQSVGFFADGKLKKIDLSGPSGPGQAVTLCSAQSWGGGTWNTSGVILFGDSTGPIYRVPDTGGSPIPVTRLDDASQEKTHMWPWFLPDGRHFLFEAATSTVPSNSVTIRIGSLDSPESEILLTSESNAIFAQGFLLFVRDDMLMAQRFNPQKRVITGDAIPVAEHMTAFSGLAPLSASENGPLVFIAGDEAPDFELVWFDRNGSRLSTLGNVQSPSFRNDPPQFSSDGKTVAEANREQKNTDIWLYDVEHGSRTRFTFDPAIELGPVWSPDGRTIAFARSRNGSADIYRKAADQSGTEQLLYTDGEQNYPTSWSPDGEYLLFDHLSNKRPRASIWILPLKMPAGGPGKPFRLTASPVGEERGQFSPDGRWIVYSSEESGRQEVFVAAASGLIGGESNGKRQISTGGGGSPRW